MCDSEFVIDKYLEDKDSLISAVGTAFDFIPIVKAFNIASALKEHQNLKDYLRFIELSIEANRDKIIEVSKHLSEDNIREIFFKSLTSVSQTFEKEKIKRFASILGNSLLIAEDEISCESRLDSIDFCDELNERDILVLGKIHSFDRITINSLSSHIAKESSEVYLSCRKLESRGLIIESEVRTGGLQKVFGSDDSYKSPEEIFGNKEFETTKIGDNIIKLLTVQKEIRKA